MSFPKYSQTREHWLVVVQLAFHCGTIQWLSVTNEVRQLAAAEEDRDKG